jgi:hypothetical protein
MMVKAHGKDAYHSEHPGWGYSMDWLWRIPSMDGPVASHKSLGAHKTSRKKYIHIQPFFRHLDQYLVAVQP